jgi:hypothetical protein
MINALIAALSCFAAPIQEGFSGGLLPLTGPVGVDLSEQENKISTVGMNNVHNFFCG